MMSEEHRIFVHASVPERRMIVVDEHQRIRLITSNTPKEVAPEVRLLSDRGSIVPLTEEMRQTYEALLRQAPDDKAVTIVADAEQSSDELLPNFTRTKKPSERYLVKPRQVEGAMAPYWVNAR
jgi:hypothetical protein